MPAFMKTCRSAIRLSHRNEELALLNQIETALASSLELDEIMNKTLALLMAHFKVEAGEIFLLEEDAQTSGWCCTAAKPPKLSGPQPL